MQSEINKVEVSERQTIKTSVRNLVEFILRSGDIDNTVGTRNEKDAMQEGSRLHRKIQKSMPSEYTPEVVLKHIIAKDEFDILIEGRADGIIKRNTESLVTIDEIKCMYMDLERLKEPIELHMAQAMCYGYIYCIQNNIEEIEKQMTYCNIETEIKKHFNQIFTFEFLGKWFNDLISDYYKWAKFQYEWNITKISSIKPIQFPFEYRKGQKELAARDRKSVV